MKLNFYYFICERQHNYNSTVKHYKNAVKITHITLFTFQIACQKLFEIVVVHHRCMYYILDRPREHLVTDGSFTLQTLDGTLKTQVYAFTHKYTSTYIMLFQYYIIFQPYQCFQSPSSTLEGDRRMQSQTSLYEIQFQTTFIQSFFFMEIIFLAALSPKLNVICCFSTI